MGESSYTFSFSDFKDGMCMAQYRHETNEGWEETGFRAKVEDRETAFLSRGSMPAAVADVIDLASAIHISDRLSRVHADKRKLVHVELPVRRPDVLGDTTIVEELEDLLYQYTQDDWTFAFRTRNSFGRLPERQPTLLHSSCVEGSAEVALWSGGLDALAGLYNRMKASSSAARFTLLGAGSNEMIQAVQRRVKKSVEDDFPSVVQHPIQLSQIRVRYAGTKDLPKNSVPRTRGFVFLLLGAACAALENQSLLHVYENGVGAINLPYRPSEVGLDHTRSVHPVMLRKMASLVSRLLDVPFLFVNPFEFQTKGQMCADLIRDDVVRPIGHTISCDRRFRARPMQCGRCSSCLLRRQALAANGFVEESDRYVFTARAANGIPIDDAESLHLLAMLAQVRDVKSDLRAASPWVRLAVRYPDLEDVTEVVAQHDHVPTVSVQSQLVQMYATYAAEWDSVQDLVGRELVSHFTDAN